RSRAPPVALSHEPGTAVRALGAAAGGVRGPGAAATALSRAGAAARARLAVGNGAGVGGARGPGGVRRQIRLLGGVLVPGPAHEDLHALVAVAGRAAAPEAADTDGGALLRRQAAR